MSAPSLKVLDQIWQPIVIATQGTFPKFCQECGARMRWRNIPVCGGTPLFNPENGRPYRYQLYACPRDVRTYPWWQFWKRHMAPCTDTRDVRRREE